jgi:dihydroorotase
MKTETKTYDLVIKGGWVIDPSQSLNGRFDVAISDGKIAAVSPQLPPYNSKQTLMAQDYLVCPGFIDLHTHVYEWVTPFGLPADDLGIHAGATTIVDQGSSSRFTFPNFKSDVVEKAQTDVRCFILLNQAANTQLDISGSCFESPEKVNREALSQLAAENQKIIRGFKMFGESGTISRWGMGVFQLGREVGDRTGLPLYVHTGELFPVVEANRPLPEQVVKQIVPYLKAGDVLAHCYSCQPDGLMGTHSQVSLWLREAIERGIRLDVGHGLLFSIDIARRMMEQGVFPYTVSSDVHGNHAQMHDDSTLAYSLCGTLGKLMALGLDLFSAIAMVTINPARVLGAEDEIGTLRPMSRADLTLVQLIEGDWLFFDSLGQSLAAKHQLVPIWVIRSGNLIQPHRRLLRDLKAIPSNETAKLPLGLGAKTSNRNRLNQQSGKSKGVTTRLNHKYSNRLII